MIALLTHPKLTEPQRAAIVAATQTRASAIAAIKAALKARTGKAWSVTGGSGTAYSWLRIDAPPARRTWKHRVAPDVDEYGREKYEEYDAGPGTEYGYSSPAERAELASVLGKDSVHHQGESVPPGEWDLYLCRALYGHPGDFREHRDWN